jgi:hypothetical protein
MDSMLNNFYNNGFVVVNDPEIFTDFQDIDSWEWINKKHQSLQRIKPSSEIDYIMMITQNIIGEKYVKQFNNNYTLGGDLDLVNGMDAATLSWHNDNQEGYNLCALLYFDSVDEEIGGMTRFRDIQTKQITGEFYPKKYDISLMNHSIHFEHIVTPMILPLDRRVALFNFNI